MGGIRRGQISRFVYLVCALSTVGLLTRLVRSGKTAELDATVSLAIQRRSNPLFVKAMHLASWAGFPPQSHTLPLVIPGLIALAGSRFDALFQFAAWGTSIISGTLKALMRRPRPVAGRFRVAPARIGGTSFPSGHVINYTGVYGMLAFLAGERISHPVLRKLIRGFLYTKIALVGPSRIYLGHHWFTDVVTSYLLGSSYLICLTALYRRLRKRKQQ